MDRRPIGVLDSGVGGLSVARKIRRLLPHEDVVYLADQANCPYGPKSVEQIRDLAVDAVARLARHDVKLVVVACNTISTAALGTLRAVYPMPFVGIVPAVKPACATTRTGAIAVLATEATLQTPAFEDLVAQFGRGVRVLRQPCPEFVQTVERGDLDSASAEAIARRRVQPLVEAGADRIILGCTHFTFLRPLIERVVGASAEVVDASDAVARQTARVLAREGIETDRDEAGDLTLLTTGDPAAFADLVSRLLPGERSIVPTTA